ncbi:MAG: EamA family transporter [Actinocatenispora sp.]
MEASLRWALFTAVAPVAWGTTYYVTQHFLPADYPLYGSVVRALPAGLLLLAVRRELPRGSWWWKSLVLGVLNFGTFFTLVYIAAQLLPSSIAATIMATSPLVMMLIAWALLSERPRVLPLTGAGVGMAGVCVMLLAGTGTINPWGVLASLSAMAMSSTGYVLAKRWGTGVNVLSSTSWQLIAGALLIAPIAVVVEGAPPAVGTPALLGFGYVTVVSTALAFVAWFSGLRRLSAGTVGLIGLLNPVTGVLLGTLAAGEILSARQVTGLGLALLGVFLGQPALARLVGRLRTGSARRLEPLVEPPPAPVPAGTDATTRP